MALTDLARLCAAHLSLQQAVEQLERVEALSNPSRQELAQLLDLANQVLALGIIVHRLERSQEEARKVLHLPEPDLVKCDFCGDVHEKRDMQREGSRFYCRVCVKGMEANCD